MFDRESGAPIELIAIPDAIRLNDLTVAGDGVIYVTDSGSSDRLVPSIGSATAKFWPSRREMRPLSVPMAALSWPTERWPMVGAE
jgi:sugar lactone lactonase YvrE